MAWALGFLYGRLLGIRRYTVLRNIRIVYPHWSKPEIYQFYHQVLPWLGYYALQTLEVLSLDEKKVKKSFRFYGLEHLEKAKALGKGYFLLSAHLGQPDMALKGLALSGENIAVITKSFSTAWADDLWREIREAPGLSFIPAHGQKTAFEIFRALGDKQGVVFVLDQFMGPPYGIEVEFFGKKTGTAYGLVRFFLKSRAPIVPCFSVYNKELAVTEIHFDPPLFFEEDRVQRILSSTELSVQEEEKNREFLRFFNRFIESMILRYPVHWMWIHRRWKKWKI
jgi:KDO2-lipid IV(A) lauroyltransferase